MQLLYRDHYRLQCYMYGRYLYIMQRHGALSHKEGHPATFESVNFKKPRILLSTTQL